MSDATQAPGAASVTVDHAGGWLMTRVLVLVVVALLVLPARPFAARQAEPAGGPYAATDARGTTLEFAAPVERIACLGHGCEPILADLGMVPVGSPFGAEQLGLPAFFGAAGASVVQVDGGGDIEELAALEPDLIYLAYLQDDRREALEAVAPVFSGLLPITDGPERYYENLRDLGALTGRGGAAEHAIARFAGVLDAIVARAPEGAATTTVLVQLGLQPEAYLVATADILFCRTLAERGLGRCPIETPADFELPYGEVDAEAILAADPDLIAYVVETYADYPGPEARTDPAWQELTAVREGRVYVDGSIGPFGFGLRELQYALELYAFHAFPGAGYPDPGPFNAYDPTRPANAPTPATPAA
jgi:ABC-type Fe3+-hydroxamate transport system substrate-binding protein